jgi:hypothetical protein
MLYLVKHRVQLPRVERADKLMPVEPKIFDNPILQTTLDPADFISELFLTKCKAEIVLECISELS